MMRLLESLDLEYAHCSLFSEVHVPEPSKVTKFVIILWASLLALLMDANYGPLQNLSRTGFLDHVNHKKAD